MTPQEAIAKIKATVCCEKPIQHFCHDNCMYGSEQCAFALAITALELKQQFDELGLTIEDIKAMKEKQTPKKVQKPRCYDCNKEGNSRCVECDYYEYKCPNCKQSAENETGFKSPNCPYCGQALDWSEDDET